MAIGKQSNQTFNDSVRVTPATGDSTEGQRGEQPHEEKVHVLPCPKSGEEKELGMVEHT